MKKNRVIGALLLVVIAFVAMLAGCTSSRESSANGPNAGPRPRPLMQISIQPADRAAQVSPALPASVQVTEGVLQQVALTDQTGKVVAGVLSPDRSRWQSTDPLAYGTTYTWSGTVVGPDHQFLPITSSFTTVTPERQVRATLNIRDGETVGIAAPVILEFGKQVSDKTAVERALQVQASVPTEGSWAWLPDSEGTGSRVHYRPRNYWQPDTQITVTARLYGLAYGEGSYGKEDLVAHFTIGRAQIVRADVNSHRMIVIRDGQQVMDFPASYGLGSDPKRITRNGIHVVMDKFETVLMSNPEYGYVNLPEHWAVRISNNGEFIHANPATTDVQGSANVTHGCVNLSTENAQQYFATAVFGDPVEVINSPIPMSATDGDIYDWTISWEDWKVMSALATP